MFPTQLSVQVLVRHGRELSCASANRSPPARRCRALLAIADLRSSRSPPPLRASPRSLPPSLVAPVLQKVEPRSNPALARSVPAAARPDASDPNQHQHQIKFCCSQDATAREQHSHCRRGSPEEWEEARRTSCGRGGRRRPHQGAESDAVGEQHALQ
jgi:hypothetical protein